MKTLRAVLDIPHLNIQICSPSSPRHSVPWGADLKVSISGLPHPLASSSCWPVGRWQQGMTERRNREARTSVPPGPGCSTVVSYTLLAKATATALPSVTSVSFLPIPLQPSTLASSKVQHCLLISLKAAQTFVNSLSYLPFLPGPWAIQELMYCRQTESRTS